MIKLSVILVDTKVKCNINSKEIEKINCKQENIREAIDKAKGKYISFICNDDEITDNYFDEIIAKTNEEFDCCYINNRIKYVLPKEPVHNETFECLSKIKPYYLEYIWSFVFRTEKLKEILGLERNYTFDSKIDEIVVNTTAITEPIYIHNPVKTEWNLSDVPYVDYKIVQYYKNIIYIRNNLTGLFNGVITWLLHIGKCFGNKKEITVLYDAAYPETEEKLKKYLNVIHREKYANYICDRYIATYLDYDIPNNVFCIEESSCFVHGLMIENDVLYPDIYDKYIGVSKRCRDSIAFGFETKKKAEYIHNPISLNRKDVKPHLHLVSTLRSEACKGLDRLEKLAAMLDEENIPYTWNVFTDVNEGTNHSGFIYRNAKFDILPYVADANYLVLLSDIESFSYSVLEALMLNTKVVVTPVDVFKEIGVVDGENAIYIPFEYFQDENKELLRSKVKQMYYEKDRKFKFHPTKLNYKEFDKLLK